MLIVALRWILTFAVIISLYVLVLIKTKDKKRYLLYFLFGSILGFYFDIISFLNGYYSYPSFYPFEIFGIPFSMTLAEGLSIGIAIYLVELIKGKLG